MTASFLKSIQFALLSLVCAVMFAPGASFLCAQAPASSTLTVKITGIRNTTGNILAILRSDQTTTVQRKTIEIDPGTLTAIAVFEKVPLGSYGVTVIHDENKNGRLDFNEMGVPLEGYAHSNNPPKRPGPPDFDETKFTLNSPATTIEIALIYWM